MTIGEALKSLRLENGLTQKEMTGGLVSESFYSKVENGIHKIDADLLIDILSLHNFDIVDFFAKLAHQKRESKPSFELLSRIIFAQNKKDIKELDRISEKIKNGGVISPTIPL
ncbi:helix-turn-helix domain-containing protein [Lactobacillus sp. PSON]|uniref:helix-turn-helix domain-containing protein n=1 Tax=Lactobacillus sp. PSON TaxID=3455454 RepID=UPI004042D234